MGSFIDLTGKKFGSLTVIDNHRAKNNRIMWRCICDCGEERNMDSSTLKSGHSKSCGCMKNERISKLNRTHGKSKSSTYTSHRAMIERCTNPNASNYKDYGMRGIVVCDRWMIFENFLEDMGERPDGHTIDRKDVNGNYEPSNCKWSTVFEQRVNTRERKDNTSGVRGVHRTYHHRSKEPLWAASISVNKKRITLGNFKNINDAITARKEAELKYRGKSS